jgi:hypothetical protein
MIVIRLVLHDRNIRAATGSRSGIGGLSKTVVTMLIESSALYAVNALAMIVLWVANTGSSHPSSLRSKFVLSRDGDLRTGRLI